ncbi:conserved hypothetical protein [Bacillus cereus ATCC 10987]|uniref:Uncharacterized protein n=1 Tax=Bacillus cereus (strain ATCC 10987 / NRS 248) TaxID=222523 RepID=Q73D78_BACC1|nr:conserved hypothetical protein [Bacillus cereus ATCC 10987]
MLGQGQEQYHLVQPFHQPYLIRQQPVIHHLKMLMLHLWQLLRLKKRLQFLLKQHQMLWQLLVLPLRQVHRQQLQKHQILTNQMQR